MLKSSFLDFKYDSGSYKWTKLTIVVGSKTEKFYYWAKVIYNKALKKICSDANVLESSKVYLMSNSKYEWV